jgi:hypothetical protein
MEKYRRDGKLDEGILFKLCDNSKHVKNINQEYYQESKIEEWNAYIKDYMV